MVLVIMGKKQSFVCQGSATALLNTTFSSVQNVCKFCFEHV